MVFTYLNFMILKQETGASVKSAARAIDLVEHVALRGPANAREISRATGIPESSLSYLLATLLARGWLVQGTDRSYSKGPALDRLAGGGSPSPVARARGLLRAISRQTGETASLFRREGQEIEAIEVETSSHTLRFTPQKGLRVPLHSFAAGKAILAAMTPEKLAQYLAQGGRARLTPRTLVDADALCRDLDLTRARGYAFANEEHTIGVIGLGVALDETYSISVAIPSPRFNQELEDRTVNALRGAAEAAIAA